VGRVSTKGWLVAIALIAGANIPCTVRAGNDESLVARSLVSAGDPARLRATMLKARRGEPITVATIGGSITAGGGATAPGRIYGRLVADWWEQAFPESPVTFVNAGVGATGTHYAVLRAERDLLSHEPDLVIIEFAINDGDHVWSRYPMEGLVRQILRHDEHVAVMMLFMMRIDTGSAQAWHAEVGTHYGIPMVSYADAFKPALEQGDVQWEQIAADDAHPNDVGHAYAASFLVSVLDDVAAGLPAHDIFPEVSPVPPPLFTDTYERTSLHDAANLVPVANDGWWYDAQAAAWVSDQPGSSVEFEIEGSVVSVVQQALRGPMGMVSASLDGGTPILLDGWISQNWSKFFRVEIFPWAGDAVVHKVRLELLPQINPGSTGHGFRLKSIGAAGHPVRDCADAIDDDVLTAGDALLILASAVGRDVRCPPWVCDVDGNLTVAATDALAALSAAVALAPAMACHAPDGLMIELESTQALATATFRVDYAATMGTLAQKDGVLLCAGLNADASFAFLEAGAGTLDVTFTTDGRSIGGPAFLAWCAFDGTTPVAANDVTVQVVDAKTVDGMIPWGVRIAATIW